MTDIPQDAIAAVKLTRADAVKLVAQAIGEIAAADVAGCEQHAAYCRDEFRARVVKLAKDEFHEPSLPRAS